MDRHLLTIPLDAAILARAKAEAAIRDMTLEAYLAGIIETALAPPGVAENATPFDGPDPRTATARHYQREQAGVALADFDRSGVSFPLEDVLADVRADLEARLASKA